MTMNENMERRRGGCRRRHCDGHEDEKRVRQSAAEQEKGRRDPQWRIGSMMNSSWTRD